MRVKRATFRLLALGLASGVSLLAAEGVARRVHPAPLFHDWLPAVPHERVTWRNLRLRGCATEASFSTNEWGLRGDPPPADRSRTSVLLAVGGSTTQCLFLDDHRTWPHLLQEGLVSRGVAVWVGNAGMNGHTTRGHLLVMDHMVPRIRPDGILLLAGLNDLMLSLSRARSNAGFDSARWLPGSFLGGSRLVQLLDSLKRRHWDGARRVDLVDHVLAPPEAPLLDPGRLSPLPADLRQALPHLAAYRRNLERVVARARALGIWILLLTQPLLYGDDPRWEERQASTFLSPGDERLVVSARTLWRMLELYNQEMRAVAREQGVPCLDLAARVPHDEAWFYDLCHFTEAGAAGVAREVQPMVEAALRAAR